MATVSSLKRELTNTLENKGILGDLKARLRTEIFLAIEDPSVAKQKLSNENLLINELIREYLIFNDYKYSDSVLVAESGQPENQLDREFLCDELNVVENDGTTKQVPLLYSLLDSFISQRSSSTMKRDGLYRKNDSDLTSNDLFVIKR